MTKQVYEDYKYFMQDAGAFYVGAKYTLKEITLNEDILFKFRKVVSESILPHYTDTDTLETVLYYLKDDDFVYQVFKQMNAEVRVSIKEKQKHLFGKEEEVYKTKYIKVKELVLMSEEEKKRAGLLIQELKGGKLALLTV
ncbi:MAG: hypothetical protein J6X94_06400 [Lachnospiraceae bacterium]|nr:hypothetical protein [Lachnospiraceae bacterium]